jgi:hypothetical protein
MGDAQLVVGAQEAQLGGTSSKSSATEAAIAAGRRTRRTARAWTTSIRS